MRKMFLMTAVVLALCSAGTYLVLDGLPMRRMGTIGDVPPMSAADAAAHRASRYRSLDSVEALLALPSPFARMEALYALAGRSDASAVQDLIFQARGIADACDRKDILLVLFARLAELDPASALALSRTPGFVADPAFEAEVWKSWGRLDLEAALEHASGLDGPGRNRAAQGLFAAYGDSDGEEPSRITSRLGVQPDTHTRSARLEALARDDPAAAVAYVLAIESPLHRRQAAAQLGRLLGYRGLQHAERWSALFDPPVLERAFEDAAVRAAAEVEPERTLAHLLASDDAASASRLFGAFTVVAAQDLDLAMLWFERLENPRQRHRAGSAIAAELARTDPLRALSWARDSDRSVDMKLYRAVLYTLVETDPELAFDDAMSIDNRRQRMSSLLMVADALSEHDPGRAAQLVGAAGDADARNIMLQQVTMNWMQSDPEAALDWLMSSEVHRRHDLMTSAAHFVARADVDAAIRLLPRLDKRIAPAWRQQIAANLAAQRSLSAAQGFIAQFEGTSEYPQLVAGVIGGLAQSDPAAAVRMLEQLPEAPGDRMLTNIVFMQYAQRSPREAAEAAASLADENQRRSVVSQVLQNWAHSDVSAAERWADRHAAGADRDHAIAAVASSWDELTASRRRMLESIEDPQQRQSAVMNLVFRIARQDRDRAEQTLLDLSLPEDQRQQLLRMLEQMRQRTVSPFIGRR